MGRRLFKGFQHEEKKVKKSIQKKTYCMRVISINANRKQFLDVNSSLQLNDVRNNINFVSNQNAVFDFASDMIKKYKNNTETNSFKQEINTKNNGIKERNNTSNKQLLLTFRKKNKTKSELG